MRCGGKKTTNVYIRLPDRFGKEADMPFGIFSSRDDEVIEDIKSQIMLRNEQVHIKHVNPQPLFFETLRRYPALYAYIAGYSSTRSLKGGAVFNVKYGNIDVPLKNVFVVSSKDELEPIFHKGVAGYLPSIIIVAARGIDVWSAYSTFNVEYGGFYANQTDTKSSSWTMPDVDYGFCRIDFEYRIGRLKLTMMERTVDKEVERLEGELFTPDMPPETKAYIAHNYLAKTVEYWLKDDAGPLEMAYRQSAYGALINKKCVCQGYAEAYKRLLDSQGIENYVLCGKVKKSEAGIGHAWNVITFNGKEFFHVDVTWDSLGGGLTSNKYFCKSDDFMRPERMWTRSGKVVCSSMQNILAVAKQDIVFHGMKYKKQGVNPAYF